MTRKDTRMAALALCAAAVMGLGVAACGGDGGTATTVSQAAATTPGANLPRGSEPVKLNPAEFTTRIDNPYFPMSPGSRWVFRETDTTGAEERVVVEVTDRTKTIANGVEARVITDVATEARTGEVLEATDDWYAQDAEGNVWYLGEATAEYKNGKVDNTHGSFEAGVNGAQAGIAIPADPQPGMSYRQEYSKGIAEDKGAVVTVGQEQVQVPFGHFDSGVLMTRDLVPLEPKVQELKFYAPDVGPVLSVHTDGAGGRAELVSYTPGK